MRRTFGGVLKFRSGTDVWSVIASWRRWPIEAVSSERIVNASSCSITVTVTSLSDECECESVNASAKSRAERGRDFTSGDGICKAFESGRLGRRQVERVTACQV